MVSHMPLHRDVHVTVAMQMQKLKIQTRKNNTIGISLLYYIT